MIVLNLEFDFSLVWLAICQFWDILLRSFNGHSCIRSKNGKIFRNVYKDGVGHLTMRNFSWNFFFCLQNIIRSIGSKYIKKKAQNYKYSWNQPIISQCVLSFYTFNTKVCFIRYLLVFIWNRINHFGFQFYLYHIRWQSRFLLPFIQFI